MSDDRKVVPSTPSRSVLRASASSQVEVRKLGVERAIAHFSQDYGFAYGLLAVFVSVGMGWLAGRLFALV